jgi:succinate dehydrogenase / fumarate reductase iron-sulfur subunit
MKKVFRIMRYDPEKDSKPRYVDYEVDVNEEMTVLDVLHEIKAKQDGSLSFRRSCRSAICGSCGMNIGGKNRLACNTQVVKLKKDIITVRPLNGFRIIKDLVVDFDTFFRKLEKVIPYMISKTPPPEKERLQSPEDFKKFEQFTLCILCGSCTSSCPSLWFNSEYLGPAAFVKAYRFYADSRDEGKEERLEAVSDESTGVWRCHVIFNCFDACPKSIDTTYAINQLKKSAIKGGK